MNTIDWQILQGQILDDRFQVGALLQGVGATAFFRVEDLTSKEELLLRAEDSAQVSAEDEYNRFREACYLRHPNLLKAIAAGQSEFEQLRFTFLVTEMVQVDLAERLQNEPVELEDVSDLLRQLVSGLNYIHSENMVYCALRAGFIWRVGSEWKLADYSQLRVEGRYATEETRRLLLMPSFECPPESNVGVVSRAWDTWSLGSVLRKVIFSYLQQREEKSNPGKPVSLNRLAIPSPFDRILERCLDPDPANRATLEDLLETLDRPQQNPEPVDRPVVQPHIEEQIAPLAQTQLPEPPPAAEPQFPTREESENTRIPDPVIPNRETFPEPAFAATAVKSPRTARKSPAGAVLGIVAASLAVILAVIFSNRIMDPQPVRGNSVPHATSSITQPASPVSASAPAAMEASSSNGGPERSVEPVRHDPFGDPPENAVDAVGAQAQIVHLLNQWVAATRGRDVDQEVNCYAPLVDTFYGQRKVSSTRLRTQEKDVFARIGKVRKFEITKVHFGKIGKDSATVSFDKNWEFGEHGRFAGSARDEVVLRPVRGQWKIASQREVKLYWVNKQQNPEPGA